MSLRCPHCQQFFSGYYKERDRLTLAQGKCTACGTFKTAEDVAAGRWRCQPCRVKAARHMAAKKLDHLDRQETPC